jgi:hypothetical protein
MERYGGDSSERPFILPLNQNAFARKMLKANAFAFDPRYATAEPQQLKRPQKNNRRFLQLRWAQTIHANASNFSSFS